MNDECRIHGAYLGAVADGESVPPETRSHLAGCARCRRDAATYRLLSQRLRRAAALDVPAAAPAGRPRRWQAALMALTAVATLVLVAQLYAVHADERVLVAAISAGSAAPEFDSSDPASIERWCEETASRPLPRVALPELTPIGARMDWHDRELILTVLYVTPEGYRVSISWLDGAATPVQRQAAEARVIGGRTAVLVRSSAGKAVVSGDAPLAQLWTSAGALVGNGP